MKERRIPWSLILVVLALLCNVISVSLYSRSLKFRAKAYIESSEDSRKESIAKSKNLFTKANPLHSNGLFFAIISLYPLITSAFWKSKKLIHWSPAILLLLYIVMQLIIIV